MKKNLTLALFAKTNCYIPNHVMKWTN